jgi:hypothetical protein
VTGLMLDAVHHFHEVAVTRDGRDCVCPSDGPDMCEAHHWAVLQASRISPEVWQARVIAQNGGTYA